MSFCKQVCKKICCSKRELKPKIWEVKKKGRSSWTFVRDPNGEEERRRRGEGDFNVSSVLSTLQVTG